MLKIAKYTVYDILRSKVLIAYTVFLLVVSLAFFSFESDPAKSVASLLSIILIVVPLISIIFTCTYFYNSYEFIELLVAQPISRTSILLGEFLGVVFSLVIAFFIGVGVPVLLFAHDSTGCVLLISGESLSVVFAAIALLGSVSIQDKAKGIGFSIMLWFYFAVIYDALVLGILFSFSDYPLDKAVILLASLNPIDLARILVLMKLDISALMGFTGAVYKDFFGSMMGMVYILAAQALWLGIPVWLAVRRFRRKNI